MSTATVLFDAPGPRTRMRHRLMSLMVLAASAVLVLWVLGRLADRGQLTAEKWSPFLTAGLWRTYVLPGVVGTLTAATVSILLAVLLGVILGVGRLSQLRAIHVTCAVLVEFFRAIPVLIMMIFAYFLYGALNLVPPRSLALAGVITGLTLYNAAVIAEIVRAGVNALPRGQSEAAAALGMSWLATMRVVLLPQALVSMFPVLISQLVVILKDTAIGYQITFVEMVRQGTVVGAQYCNYLPALMVIAVLMISANIVLSGAAYRLEHRLRSSRRRPLHAATVEQEGAPTAPVV